MYALEMDRLKKVADRPISEPAETIQRFYRANEKLPIMVTIFFGLQQVATCISSMIAVPYVISNEICPGADLYNIRSKLVSLSMFISGIATIIQTEAGMRLALLQGPSFTFLPAVHIYLTQVGFPCNATMNDFVPTEEYEDKLASIEGSLMASAAVPFLAGLTGAVGALKRYIGPMTVSTMMFLVMYSTADISLQRMATHWMSIVQIFLLFLTVLFYHHFDFPYITWKQGRLRIAKTRLFERYPFLIAVVTAWFLCLILTFTNAVSPGTAIRLDNNETLTVIKQAPWIHVPYPGEFGRPKFKAGLFVGCVVAAFSTVVETIGTYYTAARASRESTPPSHALNRGMIAEGIGTVLAGLFGVGSGICTFSMNVGIMELTKVATRSMMVVAALMLVCIGIFTKIAAILSTIPDPLLGSIIACTSAMVMGIAFATVKRVDLSLSRNMTVLGWSLMAGIIVPKYIEVHPIKTGNETFDDVLLGLLSLPMFVGPALTCLLDNIVPGATRKQRGFEDESESSNLSTVDDVYSFPSRVMYYIDKVPILRSAPFLPKFKNSRSNICFSQKF